MITQSLQFKVVGSGSVNFGFIAADTGTAFVAQLPGAELLTPHQFGVDGIFTGEPLSAFAISGLNDGNGQTVARGQIRLGGASCMAALSPNQSASQDFQALSGSVCPI